MQIKDKEIGITKEEFKINLNKNPHGTGLMFANHGKVIVRKELSDVNKQVTMFTKYTNSVRKGSIKELIIHSRWATHGNKDEFNCHPYQVLTPQEGKELWCMHNGVIQCKTIEETKSDTFNFLTYYVKPLITNRLSLLDDVHFVEMLSKYIGSGSKLVFLDSTGKTTFVNKDAGTDYNEAWISNTYSGIAPKPVYVAPKHKEQYLGKRGSNYDDDNFYYGGGGYKKKQTNLYDDDQCKLPVKKNAVILLNDLPSKKKDSTSTSFEETAIEHGIKLLITACKNMSQEEIYNFVLSEPLIASEVLTEILMDTKIILGGKAI